MWQHPCHIRALTSGSFNRNQTLSNTPDEQILYLQCFAYSILSENLQSILCIKQVGELGKMLPYLLLFWGCTKWMTTLQKSVYLVKIRHHILLFCHSTKLWNIYTYTCIYNCSTTLHPSRFCAAALKEVGRNILWCNLHHTLCYGSTALSQIPSWRNKKDPPRHIRTIMYLIHDRARSCRLFLSQELMRA